MLHAGRGVAPGHGQSRRRHQAGRLELAGSIRRAGGRRRANLFGNDNFRLLSAAGAPIDGFVHMAQRVRQSRPIALGEELTLGGRCAHAESRPNGAFFIQEFTLSDAAGRVVLATEHHRLKPARRSATQKPATRATAAETPKFAEVACRTMTPEAVTLFSSDVGNLLHSDRLRPGHGVSRANRAGFDGDGVDDGEVARGQPPRA